MLLLEPQLGSGSSARVLLLGPLGLGSSAGGEADETEGTYGEQGEYRAAAAASRCTSLGLSFGFGFGECSWAWALYPRRWHLQAAAVALLKLLRRVGRDRGTRCE